MPPRRQASEIGGSARSVEVVDRRSPAGGGVNAERTGIREEVEHAPAQRQSTRDLTVLALIEKETGLLPTGRLHDEPQSVLDDGGCRRAAAEGLVDHG